MGHLQLTKSTSALNYQGMALAMLDRRPEQETQPMTSVTISERAARRISEILKGEPTGAMLRVSVEGGGCSGFQYRFDVDRAKTEDDAVIGRDGAVVLIDSVSLQYMQGSQIDFVDDLIGASFKIANPNATASCGCGTSFTI
jgi:iron-sulfur cluster assembly accessory protein